MGQVTLVESQIEKGETLLRRLAGEGIAVTAACWVKDADEEGVILYLATPLVDEQGLRAAYVRLHSIFYATLERVDPFSVKLISPDHPIAKAVAEIHRRHPAPLATQLGGSQLGGTTIDWAYVYPPSDAQVKASP